MFPRDIIAHAIVNTIVSHKHHNKDEYLYASYPYNANIDDNSRSVIVTLSDISSRKDSKVYRIVIIGDTHDCHRSISELPECDLFIHCGDIFMTSRLFSKRIVMKKLYRFNKWLETIPAKNKILIGGNHDKYMEEMGVEKIQKILTGATYLENSMVTIDGIRIWGTPYSNGRSPNKAFQSESFLKATIAALPSDADILITHGAFCNEITNSISHSIHLCGHNHNSYGIRYTGSSLVDNTSCNKKLPLSVCAPLMDGAFNLKNRPVVLDIDLNYLKHGAGNNVDDPKCSILYDAVEIMCQEKRADQQINNSGSTQHNNSDSILLGKLKPSDYSESNIRRSLVTSCFIRNKGDRRVVPQ